MLYMIMLHEKTVCEARRLVLLHGRRGACCWRACSSCVRHSASSSWMLNMWGLLQVLSERNKRQQRRAQLLDARSQGNYLFRLLQEALLRANYLFTDHTRNALILAVFGFRVSHSLECSHYCRV